MIHDRIAATTAVFFSIVVVAAWSNFTTDRYGFWECIRARLAMRPYTERHGIPWGQTLPGFQRSNSPRW
jgi:hypothetical protein